jgi:hypothetical protein
MNDATAPSASASFMPEVERAARTLTAERQSDYSRNNGFCERDDREIAPADEDESEVS